MSIASKMIYEGELAPDEADGGAPVNFVATLQKCQRFYRLYVVLFALVFALGATYYLLVPRQYTAVAKIGPVTSPTVASGSLFGSAVAALGNRLAGGGDAQTIFNIYSQILTSTRLADSLIKNHHMLQKAFPSQWDPSTKSWHVGAVRSVKNYIAKLSGGYPQTAPSVDDLNRYLDKHLGIGQVQSVMASSILSSSNILQVSFTDRDPHQAEQILSDILDDADNIVRTDRAKDIDARIAHLETMLPRVTVAAQHDALTSILTNELETQTLIQSDNRYTSVLIDPPHASLTPTWPKLRTVVLLIIILSLLIGTGLIALLSEDGAFLARFDKMRFRWRDIFVIPMRRKAPPVYDV